MKRLFKVLTTWCLERSLQLALVHSSTLGAVKTRAAAFLPHDRSLRTTCRYYSGFGGEGARGSLFCAPVVPPVGAPPLIRLKSAMLPNQKQKLNDSLNVGVGDVLARSVQPFRGPVEKVYTKKSY